MTERELNGVTEQYILEHFDEALERGYLEAYCQPVVRTLSGRICGLEALARWEDPKFGLLTPNLFIGVLEKHRRIHELDGYIVRCVCEEMRAMMDTEAYVPVSINLSRLDYELCDIFEVVESAVRANKVPRANICIEITESLLNENETLMRDYIERFRHAGYPVWMDDFGSGYSSLNVLKDYQFDELKVDMLFLSDFSERSKRILAAIVNMAKQIGIQTLSEGVDSEEKLEFLRNIGCEKAQGNLLGAPLPLRNCLAHAQARGMLWEPPRLRKYYDDIGRLNLLSAAPFSEQGDSGTGRELNSIPISVIEFVDEHMRFLYTNAAFDSTLADVDWRGADALKRGPSARGDGVPMAGISQPMLRLLDETKRAGAGKLHFVYREEYYEIRTKLLAEQGERACMLVCVINLSSGEEQHRQKELDSGLRQIYAAYDRVSAVDLDSDTVEPLYFDSHDDRALPKRSVREAALRYAEEYIFPGDRERYLRFIDPETLAVRTRDGSMTGYFRTRGGHGAFSWKCYTVVPVRRSIYYVLVRDTEREIREMETLYNIHPQQDRDGGIPVSTLWDSLKRSSPLKFFWKDCNRRFCGASQSFLDYYGFRSLNDILGKTDEDMGWHIQPDDYRKSEERVLREGVVSYKRPGMCLVRGQNRSIVASKMPLYSATGEIVGLIGYFFETGDGSESETWGNVEQSRLDKLTGLLNTRGLDEDMFTYRDEYELRHRDFARIQISVEELAEINRRYGFDLGDGVLRAVAEALVQCCGNIATVGRESGSEFVVLSQYEEPEDVENLVRRIRAISNQPHLVDGMPFTTYLAVGTAVYSESEDLEEQTRQAKLRRMTDDVEHVPAQHLRYAMPRIFYLYESLPVAYAVYKLIPAGGEKDAMILYANKKFAELVGKERETLIGSKVSDLFPYRFKQWLAFAARAARGEAMTKHTFYEPLKLEMTMTASRVIGPGCCAFTYQVTERPRWETRQDYCAETEGN